VNVTVLAFNPSARYFAPMLVILFCSRLSICNGCQIKNKDKCMKERERLMFTVFSFNAFAINCAPLSPIWLFWIFNVFRAYERKKRFWLKEIQDRIG
jgi:hypothetical protein